jgi:hypothetical protein
MNAFTIRVWSDHAQRHTLTAERIREDQRVHQVSSCTALPLVPPQGDMRQGRHTVSLYSTTAGAVRVLCLLCAPWRSVGVLTA